MEDTQPVRRGAVRSRRGLWPTWILTGLVSLVVLVTMALLILPPLLSPAPGPGPGYDVLALGEVRATMMPGDDTLLVTQDGIVAVYIPIGAFGEAGELLVKPRDLALTPLSVEGDVERFYPVDVFIEQEGGTTLAGGGFASPILVCYLLEPVLEAAFAENPEAIRIQAYVVEDSPARWETLPGAPGWLDNQICGTVDHLSLFSLAIHRSVLVGGAGPKIGVTATPPPLPLYLPPGTE
jgi:hypothetical protein